MNNNTIKNIPKLRFPEFKNAPEWKKTPLGEIAYFFKGKGLPKSVIIQDGKYPCIHYGELFTEYAEIIDTIKNSTNINDNCFLSAINDVLMPTSDVTPNGLAKAGCINLDGVILGGDILVIRTDASQINGGFLARLIRYLERKVLQLVSGSTVFHLYASSIEKLDLLIPHIKEQKKIADCLSSIDELIVAQGAKVEALKKRKKALLQQLFPVEGKVVPYLRFPEFHNAPEWRKDKLGIVSEIVRGGSPRPIEEYITKSEGGLNWLKIGDVEQEAKYITRTTEKVIHSALTKTREVFPNNLILSNSMSFGRPYIMKIKSCIHDGWIAITKIAEITSADYLYYFISSSISQNYFMNNSAGAVVQNLNAEIIKNLPILLPSKQEQQKIIDCLSSLDELITSQTAKVKALKEHKKGLMQQIFPSNKVN